MFWHVNMFQVFLRNSIFTKMLSLFSGIFDTIFLANIFLAYAQKKTILHLPVFETIFKQELVSVATAIWIIEIV